MVAVRIPGPETIDKVNVAPRESGVYPQATAASFGAQVADARGQQAQALGDMGSTLNRIGAHLAEKRQGFEDNTYSTTFASEYQIRAEKEYRETQKEFPNGGDGFTPRLQERLKTAQGEVEADLQSRGLKPTDQAQQRSKASALNTQTHYTLHGMSYENNAKVKANEDMLDNIADQAKQEAQGPGGNVAPTSENYQAAVAKVNAAIEAQKGIIPADKLRDKHKAFIRQVQEAHSAGLVGAGQTEANDAFIASTWGAQPRPPVLPAAPVGLTEPGNIDMSKLPTTTTPQGKTATVRTINVGLDENGKAALGQPANKPQVLIPTVKADGTLMSDQEAVDQYNATGQHLGKFDSQAAAAQYGKQLSKAEGERLAGRGGRGPPPDNMPTTRNPQGLEPWIVRTFEIESGAAYRSGSAAASTGSNRGLGQFSPDLERRYGISPADRHNPATQAEALRRERADFEKQLGRPLQDWEFYYAHQQGLGGAKALLEHPQMPAWQALRQFASGEYNDARARSKGFRDGDAYAKAAISGNIPDTNPLKVGPVDAVSAQQFTELWQQKWGGAPTNPDVGMSIKWTNANEAAAHVNRRKTEDLVKADLTSIQDRGKPNPLLTYDQVARGTSRDYADAWQEARQDAQRFYDVTQDFGNLPAGELRARVESLRPGEDVTDAGYLRQKKMYEDAQKKADAVSTARVKDPALSVNEDPQVREAASAAKWNDPATLKPLITARLAAQERAGVPVDVQRPVTNAEALAIVSPLGKMLPGLEKDIIQNTVGNLQQLFGNETINGVPISAIVLNQGLNQLKLDQETSQRMASLARKLALRQPVLREDIKDAEAEAEQKAANAAIKAGPAPPLYGPGSVNDEGYYGVGAPPGKPEYGYGSPVTGIVPSEAALNELRAHPELANEFNRKFNAGRPGYAEHLIETYRLLYNPKEIAGFAQDVGFLQPPPPPPTTGEPMQPRKTYDFPRTTGGAPIGAGAGPGGVRLGGRMYRVQRGESGKVTSLTEE